MPANVDLAVCRWIAAYYRDEKWKLKRDWNFQIGFVLSGVQQGSVWDPLLFLVFIN